MKDQNAPTQATQHERWLPSREQVVTHHRTRSGLVGAAVAHGLPEFLMEMFGLAIFMISACIFTILIEHPSSPVRGAVASPLLRRALIGLAMGLTAVGIIYSPWGKRSGAHINPAVTLSFFRLGKMDLRHMVSYVVAQTAGGILGMLVAALLLGNYLVHPAVNYVATVPGSVGTLAALLGEFVISFILMTVVLHVSNSSAYSAYTGLVAGSLVALFITFEAPLSGMSMNPARTLGSAVSAGNYDALWLYFIAPIAGMLTAAEVYVARNGRHAVRCAKLHHVHTHTSCVFRCRHGREAVQNQNQPPTHI